MKWRWGWGASRSRSSMSESTAHHRAAAAGQVGACAVLSVSDTRTPATDQGGRLIIERLENAGHRLAAYQLTKDEPAKIEAPLQAWIEDTEIDLILTTGGTGISRRDTTIEVVERLLDKPLPGFGELFRMLSWQEIQAAAMLSRATAGLASQTMIFAMPGSVAAVRLALDQLIIPELRHLIWERRR